MKIFKNIKQFFVSEVMMFLFLCAYIIVGFGTVSPFTCGKEYFNIFCNIIKIWGIVILLFCMFDKKKWKLDARLILLILFVLSYLASCYVSAKYGGILNNIKGVVWLIIQAILLAAILNKSFFAKWLKKLFIVYICFATIFALFSLFYLVNGFIYIPSLNGLDTLWMGLCSGRLYGFYKDPNYGAVASCVCIYLLLFLCINKRNFNNILLACVVAIPQFLYISVTGSRTAFVAIVCSVFVFAIVIAFKILQFKKLKLIKKTIISFVCACLCSFILASCFFSFSYIFDMIEPNFLAAQGGSVSDTLQIFPRILTNKTNEKLGIVKINNDDEQYYFKGTNKDTSITAKDTNLVDAKEKILSQTDIPEFKQDESSKSKDVNAIQINSSHTGLLARNEESDISNNRFDLWKTAIEIWKTSPIIGVSHYNILNYAKELFPSSRYVTMGQVTSHNAYFDILAAQGIIGISIFGALTIITLIGFVKLLKNYNGKNAYCISIMLGLFVFLLVSACFYPELIYINTIDALFFWYIISLVRSQQYLLLNIVENKNIN